VCFIGLKSARGELCRLPLSALREGGRRKLMDYKTLVKTHGRDARQVLLDALHSPGQSGVGGGMDRFRTALFCLLEREYRRNHNRKRAIFLWEMFLQGNWNSPETHILVPNYANPGNSWINLLLLNIDADSGVPEAVFRTIQTAISTIIAAYTAPKASGGFDRLVGKMTLRLGALDLGGVVPSELFTPAVQYIIGRGTLNHIENPDEENIDSWGVIVKGKLHDLAKLVESVGFTGAKVGLI
jgi:hypothetical protein